MMSERAPIALSSLKLLHDFCAKGGVERHHLPVVFAAHSVFDKTLEVDVRVPRERRLMDDGEPSSFDHFVELSPGEGARVDSDVASKSPNALFSVDCMRASVFRSSSAIRGS